MKKPYLLFLGIMPLLTSCNKSGSFPNPFPNDSYKKIGFTIDESNEKITRPLTNSETNLVRDTIEKKDEYDKKIKSNKEAYRETRDYTRAFAGEFKHGYNVSNIMKKEKFTMNAQDISEGGIAKKVRLKTHNEIETVTQYSYGEIKNSVELTDYHYYATSDIPGKEANDRIASNSVNNRSTKRENNEYTKTTDDVIVEKKGTEYEDDIDYKHIRLHQSDYIFAPDGKCGANNKNEIILVSATQVKHVNTSEAEQGFFVLQDGRKYQAMDNTLTVTKLTPQDNNTWGLATYVRTYKETVITSEVIQPNVQVKKLSSPITISFVEEVNHFSTEYKDISNALPEVTP